VTYSRVLFVTVSLLQAITVRKLLMYRVLVLTASSHSHSGPEIGDGVSTLEPCGGSEAVSLQYFL